LRSISAPAWPRRGYDGIRLRLRLGTRAARFEAETVVLADGELIEGQR